MRLTTLKRRSEFQKVRGGGRYSGPAFLMEGVKRSGDDAGPRFGFTVTKKLGGAVVRNRIRRRLRAALTEVSAQLADPAFDYVIVARSPALDRSFLELRADFVAAFDRIRRARPTSRTHASSGVASKPDRSDEPPTKPRISPRP